MKSITKIFFGGCFLCCALSGAIAAPDLNGMASVNVTSDTSATAKNMAMAEARRQIITDVLSNYTNPDQFSGLMKKTKDTELAGLISSTGIDGEKISATTYSADIKMGLDLDASQKWLNKNGVKNWLTTDENVVVDKSVVVVDMSGGLRGMIDLNSLMRDANIDYDINGMSAGQITITIPKNSRDKFANIARGAGWDVSDSDGNLLISK